MTQDRLGPTGHDYDRLAASLRGMGLLQSATPRLVELTGGVSSLIILVEDGARKFCAKSALDKLKVEQDWQAPVHRNQAEVAWMRTVADITPGAVPAILGEDAEANIFAMQWLDPDHHPVWKQQMMDGHVSVPFARQVGDVLGIIHAATGGDARIAAEFPNAEDFDALRLAPYLKATATVHPKIAERLLALSDKTDQTRFVLIHGDVSPKNILVGPHGPIILDAECATHGDPAFDLAFCLNHLILKIIHRPACAEALADSYRALVQSYFSHVNWEPVAEIEARTAALLPALALARVDGKSPADYLNTDAQAWVRKVALAVIISPVSTLEDVLNIWMETLS